VGTDFIAISQNYVNSFQWGEAYDCPSGISATSLFHHLLVFTSLLQYQQLDLGFFSRFFGEGRVKLLPPSVRGKLAHPQMLLKHPLCSCQSLREQNKKKQRDSG